MSKEIDHKYTDEIVCPYCGQVFPDSWEYSPENEDLGLIYCDECEREFYASRNIDITYSTKKAKYGICKRCGKENIVLHSMHANYGKFEDLCKECAEKEKQKLLKVYFESL